ncbi:MAG: hypothetical protein ACTHOJ_02580 [Sphingomonas oligoaromativorans]
MIDEEKRHLKEAIYLSLSSYNESKKIRDVSISLFDMMKSLGGIGSSPSIERIKVMESLVHGLLTVACLGENEWGYRELSSGSFTDGPVGYKPFKACYDGLLSLGYLDIRKGYYDRQKKAGECTRMRASPSFLAFLEGHGITPGNFRSLFTPISNVKTMMRNPIRVRAAKSGDWFNPHKGQLLPVDLDDPVVTNLAAGVQRLNAYFHNQRIEGCTHPGFYRLFNQGDHPDFAFNKGGRLYSYGDYQRMKRKRRPCIRINGETVVEVDVAGSHLTLLHTMLGFPLLPSVDPYDVPGIPRAIVKSFIVMTIGNGGFQRRWSQSIAREYEEEHGSKLHVDFPLRTTREAILNHLPVLSTLPGSGISWADLQYRESQGLIATVEALAFEHGVPALPLHDSVIVPASKAELAARVMKEAFQLHAGTVIKVTVKGACEDDQKQAVSCESNAQGKRLAA